jgi:hypothetical protein
MGILSKLQKQGSIFTNLDGATPEGFNTQVSVLNPKSLTGSQFDLDGKTPDGYINNLPR